MASQTGKLIPPMMWAQRKDKIFFTINLEDVKDPKLTIEETKLSFSGHGGTDKQDFQFTIDFYEEVNVEESKYVVLPRNIPCLLVKKNKSDAYWPRLTKEKQKIPQLKTDFDKWKEEDDSDVEDAEGNNFQDMMSQMGNFNGGDFGGEGPPGGDDLGADQADDEDSDDEKLPDLE